MTEYSRPSRIAAQRPLDRPRDSRLMRSAPFFIAVLFVLVVGAVLYFRAGETRREASEAQAPPQRAESAPPAGTQAQPPPADANASQAEIRHPLPQVAQPAGAAPLPPLSDSDDAMREAFVSPLAKQIVGDLVISKDIARRIVATVDNLPRQKAGTQLLPFKAPARQLAIERKGERVMLSPRNYARYAAYVRLAQAVDVKRLVALYVRFYPLFQQAYEELGYPKKYFNDRAVEAIDDLLAAPDVDGPIALVQPKVVYELADPELQELSAGQKLLIRIGPQNAAAIKVKLRELRRELVVDAPAADR